MVTTNGIPIAHAKPDGVERGKEGKRQHRANGGASDQHISRRMRYAYKSLRRPSEYRESSAMASSLYNVDS